jgi:hypothetical protein
MEVLRSGLVRLQSRAPEARQCGPDLCVSLRIVRLSAAPVIAIRSTVDEVANLGGKAPGQERETIVLTRDAGPVASRRESREQHPPNRDAQGYVRSSLNAL